MENINQNTFDLMEIFSELLYFDKRFKGSSSIKKVLPVLSDISYDDLAVPNGAIAASILAQVAKADGAKEEIQQHRENLLTYCKQDTRAMVAIRNKVLSSLSS
jgi:hypothetical protein